MNANVFVPQTQQRSFEIGQGQTARARVGKKLGAADRGRPVARDRVGVRAISSMCPFLLFGKSFGVARFITHDHIRQLDPGFVLVASSQLT